MEQLSLANYSILLQTLCAVNKKILEQIKKPKMSIISKFLDRQNNVVNIV